jgi:uncharacterized damage-inducible protein DinB
MKDLLLTYTQYNIWANQEIIKTINAQPEPLVDAAVESSFPTIRATIYHIWSAEYLWLMRLQRAEQPIWAAHGFEGDFKAAIGLWQEASNALHQLVTHSDPEQLSAMIPYKDLKQQPHETAFGQIVLHVANHSTYHRGQLVTMLRALGVKDIPATDYIQWIRLKP